MHKRAEKRVMDVHLDSEARHQQSVHVQVGPQPLVGEVPVPLALRLVRPSLLNVRVSETAGQLSS